MIKLARTTSLTDFTSLLNSSIINATFPSEWKKALLRPLAKIRTPRLPSDTRPIALLSECSKVLERLVREQLSGYLEVHRLLSPQPAGFWRGHNTQTALLGVLEDVRQAIDDRMLTLLILFDFSKAFDSIPHARLLAKLRGPCPALIFQLPRWPTSGRCRWRWLHLGLASRFVRCSSGQCPRAAAILHLYKRPTRITNIRSRNDICRRHAGLYPLYTD